MRSSLSGGVLRVNGDQQKARISGVQEKSGDVDRNDCLGAG